MISHWRDRTPAPGPSTQRRVSYFFFFFFASNNLSHSQHFGASEALLHL